MRTQTHFVRMSLVGMLATVVAVLGMSAGTTPPHTQVGGIPVHIDPFRAHFEAVPLSGSGAGRGVATIQAPLPDDPSLLGLAAAIQWFRGHARGDVRGGERPRHPLTFVAERTLPPFRHSWRNFTTRGIEGSGSGPSRGRSRLVPRVGSSASATILPRLPRRAPDGP